MVGSHPRDGRPGGEEMHIHVFDIDSIHDNWDSKVKTGQYLYQSELKQWAPLHNLTLLDGTVKAYWTLRRDVRKGEICGSDEGL